MPDGIINSKIYPIVGKWHFFICQIYLLNKSIDIKFWRIRVPTRDSFSRRILKASNLRRVEAWYLKPKIVFSRSTNTSPYRNLSNKFLSFSFAATWLHCHNWSWQEFYLQPRGYAATTLKLQNRQFQFIMLSLVIDKFQNWLRKRFVFHYFSYVIINFKIIETCNLLSTKYSNL